MEETQATTDEATKTIKLSYTHFGFERGTEEEIAAYELRNADQTPDDLDDDMISTVYDERVEIAESDIEKTDDVSALLGSIYRGLERDQIPQVDRTEYRSPMIGDVFAFDGTAYVVARFGFEAIETAPEAFELE